MYHPLCGTVGVLSGFRALFFRYVIKCISVDFYAIIFSTAHSLRGCAPALVLRFSFFLVVWVSVFSLFFVSHRSSLRLSSRCSLGTGVGAAADGRGKKTHKTFKKKRGWWMAQEGNTFFWGTRQKGDAFLRDGTASRRFLKRYRAYPYPVRMAGLFLVGFSLGGVIEIFACKTHLYESVMANKDARRHDFDEFVVDFRENIERWQRQDMVRRPG